MRAKPILVLGGACLVGLAVHLTAASTAEQATTTPPPATPPPIAKPLASSPRAEARFAVPVTPTTSAPAAPISEDGRARDLALVARIEQDLDERLRAERVDPAWAPATERAIASAIAGPTFAGLSLDAVSCGRTMCKLVVTVGERITDVDGKLEELTTTQPLRAGGFLHMAGPRTATMFVARAGTKLPPAPRG